jgi:Ser/Thr protein kinase RdoA (MazF antagonist)
MSSPLDAALAQRDPALPGLAALLDTATLLGTLQTSLTTQDLRSVRVEYLRYKPGTNCIAALSLNLGGVPTLAYAKALRVSEMPRLDSRRQSTASPHDILLPSIATELHLFPSDPKLPHLPRITDIAWATPRSPRPSASAPHSPVLSIEPIAYKPERRFVARWHLADGRSFVAKTYLASDFDAVRRNAEFARNCHAVSFSRLSGVRERRATLLFPWIHAPCLAELLRDTRPPSNLPSVAAGVSPAVEGGVSPPGFTADCWAVSRSLLNRRHSMNPASVAAGVSPPGIPDSRATGRSIQNSELPLTTFQSVGACLARLHQHPVPSQLPGRFPPDEARRVDALLPAIAWLLPESRPLLEHLVPCLAATIRLHPPARRLCHGDFHAGQVLLTPEGPHFLDLDELHVGDPVTDLASFIAHLERETIRGSLAPRRRDSITADLLHGYASELGTPIPARLPTLVAARLLAETPHFFRTRDPHWSAHTLAAVERASEIAGTASSHTPCAHTTVPTVPVPLNDPALPTLASALDPATANELILPLLATQLGLESPRITGIELRRHKPGRRCLIEYQIAPGDGTTPVSVFAKLRRRGVDAPNFAFLQALSVNGFHPDAPDGSAIPSPLGAVPSLGLVLHQRVPGSPLTQRLADPDAPDLAVRTADALLKLHRTRHTLQRRHTVTDELDHLEVQLSQTAEALPELRQRILGVLDDCHRLAQSLPANRPAQLHRDFYPDQVLIDGARMWIVDFDLAAVGDPALDVGNFIAHLIEHGLRFQNDATALMPVIQTFQTRYLGHSEVAVESIHAWTTLALARHIAISHRMTERHRTTPQLVSLCEERLSLGLPTRPTPSPPNKHS